MAVLAPTAVWSDIRQIETTDPVIGGPPNPDTGAGFSNIPNLQLGQRDEWLRDRVGGFTQTILYTVSATLSPDAVGSRGLWMGVGAGVLTLPPLASVPDGCSYYLVSGDGPLSIQASGVDTIIHEGGVALGPIVLSRGDTVRITRGQTSWAVTGGTLASQSAPTPTRFANDKRAANTEFVQRALGNYSASIAGVAGSTLTAADVGRVVICNLLPGVITLPLANSVPSGAQITFFITGPGWTVARQGGDMINLGLDAVTSRALGQGDHLTLVSGGGSIWNVVGGAGQLAGTSAFGSSLAASGWQRLPSGLIMQWGSQLVSANNAATAVTFPVAFPSSVLQVLISPADDGTSTYRMSHHSPSLTGFTARCTSTTAVTSSWLALGR